MSQKLKLPLTHDVRGAIRAGSFVEADNTIEIVLATETEVARRDWDGTPYIEVLRVGEGHTRTTRLAAGAVCLIDSHRTYSGIAGILGKVVGHRFEGTSLIATVRLSQRADLADVIGDIRAGIISNVSCGYDIFEVQVSGERAGVPILHITDWEPTEASMVIVPADTASRVRSADETATNYHEFLIPLNTRMDDNNTPGQPGTENGTPVAEGTRAATPTTAPAASQGTGQGNAAPAATPAPGTSDTRAHSDAATAERERVLAITKAVRTAGITDPAFADALIAEGVSADVASSRIIDRWAANGNGSTETATRSQNGAPTVTTGTRQAAAATAMEEALQHRAGLTDKLTDGAREFRGMSLVRMAEESLRINGADVRGLSEQEIARRVFQGTRAGLSTSDFPRILGNTVNRTLRAAYEGIPTTFQNVARRTTAKDFREITRTQLSGMIGGFEKVGEGGEYKRAKFSEASESYKVDKFGRIVSITWETLINDDLDAFSRIPQAIAEEARQMQADIVWGVILGNPNMGDGNALFGNAHKNLGVASFVSADGLAKARAAFRKQTGLEGRRLNLTPKYIVVGSDCETEVLKLTSAAYTPTTQAQVNPWKGLAPIVEPRLDDVNPYQWFLFADPSRIDTVEYAFLEGNGELFTEEKESFETDGVDIKARMVMGAAAIDWRGMYKNAGQAPV